MLYWLSSSNFVLACIKVGFCTAAAAAGATASSSVRLQGGIFVLFIVVAVPIAWKATYVLYESFVVFLFLVLGVGLILGPTRRRFCLVVRPSVFVVGAVVLLRLCFLVLASVIPGASSVILGMVVYG